MPKKTRSDTLTNEIQTFANIAKGVIQPPSHINLRDEDYPFWESIVCARARETWSNVDLENAANLARCKSDIERLQKEINDEGDVLVNQKGTQIVNPKHALLETLSRRAMAISRMLHVHAEATVGKSEDARNKLAKEREVAEVYQAFNDDDLIARPN